MRIKKVLRERLPSVRAPQVTVTGKVKCRGCGKKVKPAELDRRGDCRNCQD